MRLRGHGNGLAIAIAALALIIAGTGTAVAVKVATTSLSDPVYPKRKARIDASGHLLTTGTVTVTKAPAAPAPVVSTLASGGVFSNSGVSFLTSPTTAGLALTNVLLSETRLNGTVAGSDLSVALVTTSVNPNGSCSTVASRILALVALSSDGSIQLVGSTPVATSPIGKAKYCLALSSSVTDGQADATAYFPRYSFSGYVRSGTYAGIGTAASPAVAHAETKKVR